MRKVIVIAPHPDDETLGCGGTLLRHRAEGDETHWLIVTAMTEELGFSAEMIAERSAEIDRVAGAYGFNSVHRLNLPTTRLDAISKADLICGVAGVFKKIGPEVVYLPCRKDVHTDHRAVFDAAVSCTKWFRHPGVKRVMAYETLSETDFSLSGEGVFNPNVFMDITAYIDRKIEIMNIYGGETGEFPFPRSATAIRALAEVRGAASGHRAAEAFMLLKEIL